MSKKSKITLKLKVAGSLQLKMEDMLSILTILEKRNNKRLKIEVLKIVFCGIKQSSLQSI
ncbi:hypothetical protein HOO54_14695 [Bacillus sp. WMMC1349]|uniref:hypothetical protein n=1 Tax=Bacillus sp. WMMC1349 TaxID=2736254 RepID=UPI001553DC03|nr:hypothetical protein [Bacillus sp. WMMC1349]NPC93448.1 hypothetical protein [Bacillus sp. WMMC1349]